MNRSFDHVMRSPLNHSKTKEAHLFPQAKRFKDTRPPHCKRDSYDLSKEMLASTALLSKSTVFTRDQRWKRPRNESPSPDAYQQRSFTDLNRQGERGHAFGMAQRLKYVDKNKIPGPGSYQQSYNPEKKLMYTMRSKMPAKDASSKLGPGHYRIEGYSSVANFSQIHAKYPNSKNTVIGREKRFRDKTHITAGPGPSLHGGERREVGHDPTYSFGTRRKEASYIGKSIAPGPGSYNEFSQFSELRKGKSATMLG